jgi:arginine deiminase
VWSFRGADNEVGRLRSVIVHRPGAELKRMTPRSCGTLPFGRVPWVGRAQEEHDAFAQALRGAGVEVLYLTELLQDALEYVPARQQALASVLADPRLGDDLRAQLRQHLDGLDPETLSQVLISGLTRAEFRTGRGAVYQLLSPHDFVVDPLPNLLFTRDSSVWLGDNVAVASPGAPGRRREALLMQAIYDHHPRFAGSKTLYEPGLETLEGGDVVLLAPGVIAVGTGGQTTAAGVERLARRVFDAGAAHTVLAVPIEARPGLARTGPADGGAARRGPGHLDTMCTMVDTDAAVMHPALAYSLTARSISPRADGLRVSHPQPFLEAAALAMGIGRLRVIDTGLDPAIAGCGQWDDGGNTLTVGPRLAVSFERNVETNARLEAAGIQVIRVPGGELGSDRGGPRCLSCPVGRDPVTSPDHGSPDHGPPGQSSPGHGSPDHGPPGQSSPGHGR